MDKFDDLISRSKPSAPATTGFVDSVMDRIRSDERPKRRLPLFGIVTAAAAAAVCVLLLIVGTNRLPVVQQTLPPSGSPNVPSASTYSSDLQTASTSVDQGAADLAASDNAINDNQRQITVPTE